MRYDSRKRPAENKEKCHAEVTARHKQAFPIENDMMKEYEKGKNTPQGL